MLSRPGVESLPLAHETGGLSGLPLKPFATRVVARLYATLQGRVPIIGVGGIETGQDAWDKLVAGADLVQVYTGFIYRGPGIVAEIVSDLAERVRQSGKPTLAEAVAAERAARPASVKRAPSG